jgi:hypothetical protein
MDSKKVADYVCRNTFAFWGNVSGDVGIDVRVGVIAMRGSEFGYSVEEIGEPEELIIFFDYLVEPPCRYIERSRPAEGFPTGKFRSQ